MMNCNKIKRILPRLLVTTIVATLAFPVLAQPTVNSVSGEIQQGNLFTLYGNGFGDRDRDNITIYDTVDNQKTYESLPTGSQIPINEGLWTRNGSEWADPVTVDRSDEQRHRFSSASIRGKARGYVGWPRAFNNSSNQNLYVSWWFKPYSDPNENEGHNKFIRIWDDLSGDYTRVSWTQVLLGAYENTAGESPSSYGGWNGKVGEWNRLEIFVSGEKGTIDAWTNGQLIHDVNDFRKEVTLPGLTITLVGFDPNYGDRYSNFVFQMDEIYASSTLARVEVSTSASWQTARSKKELQETTSWSTSEISFELNLGQFSPTEQLYVYVIDSNGNVNSEGYKLDSNCPECPQSPTLEIQ